MEQRIVSEILKKNEPFLSRHLVLSSTVLDKLYHHGVLADFMRRKIMLHPVDRQVELLLKNVENRGLPTLRKFLEVLKDTGHGYLVDVILDTEAIPVSDLRPASSKLMADTGNNLGLKTPPRTVHGTYRDTAAAPVASLNSLLQMRQDKEHTTARGAVLPRTVLADPAYPRTGVGVAGGAGVGGMMYQPSPLYSSDKEITVPSMLNNLGQVFNQQQKETEQALVVLRQEEMAIKQLMEQNARDQQKIRRKQFAMTDISRRLADIHARTNEFYEPSPDVTVSRYRLAQLSQIPWTLDQ